jgi:hypothetical protein
MIFLGAAAPSVGSVGEGPGLDLEAAIQFRETFGLRADPDFVLAVATDASPDSSRFGVPLTAAEVEDLDARMALREAFEPALEAAIKSPAYAGAFIDQLRGGQPVILTTDQAAMERGLAEAEGSELAEIRVVDRTLEELGTLSEEIQASEKELGEQGVNIVSVGIDIVGNRVQVGVAGSSVENSASITSRFGRDVRVFTDEKTEFDACTVEQCWSSTLGGMKGGLRVRLVSNPGAHYCTSGFLVTKTDTGALSVVTAGHCIALGNNSGRDYWGHAGTPSEAVNIGYEAQYADAQGKHTWFEGSNADVALIVLDAESVAAIPASSSNMLHVSDPGSNGFVTSVRAFSSQVVGDSVCRMGYGTYLASGSIQGVTCGTISVYDINHESCNGSGTTCYTIHHTKEVSFDSVGGDSGGPVFHATGPGTYAAYGTHVHSWVTGDPLPKHGWYSPINYGRSQYQTTAGFTFDVCITGSC